MAKAFEDTKLAEKLESVPLSHQTIQRRIIDMEEQAEKSLLSLVEESIYFSLCLDESTGQSNIAQLLIYVRTTSKDFSVKEELFDVCFLHVTTKGKDIYDAVKKSVDRMGDLSKCSVIITDGALAMTGNKIGLKGLLKKDGVNCPVIHCLIHQGALCGTAVMQDRLAFLTGLTNHLNKFNLSLQGRNKLVSYMVGVVNGFRNKLRIFKHSLEKNEPTYFPSCEELLKEFKEQDKVVDFSDCSFEIQETIEEFDSRFIEVED
ncbi:hypothetical protein PR048_017323 [Dryococelus australis]|uniref:Uncharacterized protein n=1 Tax=Dryococelus australis TaxID=614101 RepID=A0ABQ9H9F1_9NEOP|nr:hypothetical protein PR048_017323 [Dryococelus australis]